MGAINCVVPGCKTRLAAEATFVPELSAIRQAEKKSGLVTVADLSRHTICGRHNHVARQQGVHTFRFLDTVKMIEQREIERANAGKFFQMYAPLQQLKIGATPVKKLSS